MSQLAIIVQTCDKYSDVWEAFYKLLFKYWSDCPFQIYHVSEFKKADYKGVITINTGNLAWSAMLKFALDKISSPFVLLLQEDYLLIKKADSSVFHDYLKILENEKPAYLRIFPVPGPDQVYKNFKNIGLVSFDAPYSISTQAAIWNKNDLINFLVPQENPWEFENNGSQRAHRLKKPILSVKTQAGIKIQEQGDYAYTYLCTAVFKGRWMKEADILAKKEDLKLDYNYRPLETWEQYYFRKYYLKLPIFWRHIWDFARSNRPMFYLKT